MQTILFKARILNVIELSGQSILSVESFIILSEKENAEIVQQAEALYKKKAIANGAPRKGFDEEIGFDHYENGTYFVQLVWSD